MCSSDLAVENTELYIKALEHDKVKILGHIGRSGLEFDVEEVAGAAKSMNKMIEINEASFGRTCGYIFGRRKFGRSSSYLWSA